MKYFKKLIGDNIYLSPVNPDDFELYTKWLNDENITKYLTIHDKYVSLNGEKEFLNNIVKNDEYVYAIVNNNDELLGNIGLHSINNHDGSATLGIFIGDEKNLGKGYGTEAIKLLVNYGFNELRLNNIMLTVYDFNERAIKSYIKCGFKEFGRRHEALFRNGKYNDLIYMEIIKEKK